MHGSRQPAETDYLSGMTDRSRKTDVGLAEFKARLSAYLRRVRRGETLTVLNRDIPIARVLPWDQGPAALPGRPPTRRLRDVAIPRAPGGAMDSLAALLEERQGGR
jgi:prevent-host-death family protein